MKASPPDYDELDRSERTPRRVVDHTAAWAELPLITTINGQTEQRIKLFCERKRITVEALGALGTRIAVRRSGKTEFVFAGDNGVGAITAIKYRPVDGSSHDSTSKQPSTWLRPIVVGKPDSLDWFISEGETDAARLWDLVGDVAAIMALPTGALTFKPEWAALIPRGATVALCHDADEDGDRGAEKAAQILGGHTVRVRPPVEGADWCDWPGSRDDFLGIVKKAAANATYDGLVATPLTVIQMRSIEWLERPLWQRSAFELLSGAKGAGKGTYLAGLAARISKNANVLFVSTEDSAEIDLKPRLVAAGATLERCFIINKHVRLPDDVDRLRELALGIGGVGLLVIDPVANHIGDRNSNSDAEVRDAIAPLNKLADELDCLLIGVRHPGKDRSRGAVASILGSTAWVDTPRAVVMIAHDDEDDALRHIQVVAGNRSLNGSAQAFRIEAVDVEGLTEPITLAVELGASPKSVDDLLSQKNEPAPTKADAIQAAILEALETGEKTREFLDALCKDELGVNPDTIYKSGLAPLREMKRIRARKAGLNAGWYWRLGETNQ